MYRLYESLHVPHAGFFYERSCEYHTVVLPSGMAYIDIIVKIFGSINSLLDSVSKAKDLKVGKAGHKNLVLAELELNISLLVHDYLENGTSEQKIIHNLDCSHIEKAMQDNFDFSEVKKGKLKKSLLHDEQIQKYEGYTTEQLFRKIYVKINELKRVETLYPIQNSSKLRMGVRLKNLLKLLMVTASFVTQK